MSRQLRSATKPKAELPSPIKTPTATGRSNSSVTLLSKKRSRADLQETILPTKPPPKKSIKIKENSSSKPAASKSKSKKASVTLGQDPYPDHPFPTPEQCQIVHDLLTTAHGPAVRPHVIRASTAHAGCGEVPCVLDALMRTLLSANTSASNSTRAFKGVLAKYGVDPSHGGANWEAVRKGKVNDLFKAIEQGGLANVKSKAMKTILDEVYEDGLKNGQGLSLDYLHQASDEEAMTKLTSFKGIGVKTATCVMMFCLRRAAFPVDTHVFRISKLLGWVPTPQYQREIMEKESRIAPLEVDDSDQDDDREEDSKISKHQNGVSKPLPNTQSAEKRKRTPPVTRDNTFLHMDARVPAELKYGLHQLMIRHGRYCPTCNASGGRKYGIGQNGKPLMGKVKQLTVKEEKDDGTFEEVQVKVMVKEEVEDSDDNEDVGGMKSVMGAAESDLAIKMEDEASESKPKAYIPIDAAGGTGQKTGGNPDGSCILGDMISWERLI